MCPYYNIWTNKCNVGSRKTYPYCKLSVGWNSCKFYMRAKVMGL